MQSSSRQLPQKSAHTVLLGPVIHPTKKLASSSSHPLHWPRLPLFHRHRPLNVLEVDLLVRFINFIIISIHGLSFPLDPATSKRARDISPPPADISISMNPFSKGSKKKKKTG